MRAIGFFYGARTLVSAFGRVVRAPGTWPYVLIPTLVFGVLCTLSISLVFLFARPALDRALQGLTSVGWLHEILLWVSLAGSALLGVLVALLLTTPLSAPALEHLVRRTEAELGVPERASLGFFREMACGLRAQIAPLAWTVPAWFLLLGLDAIAPFLAPLTVTVRALLAAFGVAWALIDYPLTLRGVPVRTRFALLRRAPGALLGFGGAFALLFWVPGCGLVFLGVGVVGATELLASLATRDPALAATLGMDPPARGDELTPGDAFAR